MPAQRVRPNFVRRSGLVKASLIITITSEASGSKRRGKMAKKSLKKQAAEIIKIAEESGVQSNYFFVTTFKRYQTQLGILEELEKVFENEGMLVSKEYVKGRKNLYSNPAIAAYNKTADSANKTVAILIRIIKNFNVEETAEEEEDVLMKLINGSDDE